MASSGKKKTTMAKLTRERTLRERRLNKKAKKDARKLNPSDDLDSPVDALNIAIVEEAQPEIEQSAPVAEALAHGPS